MKNIKSNIFKKYNAIIAALIGLLGYSCSDGGDDPVVEYGTPSAKFIVKGKVVSAETKKGIENIRVIMVNDTTFTDSEGKYQVVDEHGFPVSQKYTIKLQDIDGDLNGEFQDKESDVEFKDPKFTGGNGNWYSGETSKEFDIEMDNK